MSNRIPCQAHSTLHRAQQCLDRGDVICAGVHLRESARQLLAALCTFFQIDVNRTPRRMSIALRAAGHLEITLHRWFLSIIDTGNQCAHCDQVPPNQVQYDINKLGIILQLCRYEIAEPKGGAA